MKVMIVDDVGYVRHYLDRLVSRHGHTAVTAASGHHALEILRNDNQIDVVITDLLMPGIDGTELFQAARQIERFNDEGPIPPPAFILITALRPSSAAPRKELNLLQQAVDLGFADVMLKPVDNDLLIRQLAAIQKQRAEGAGNGNRGGRTSDSSRLRRQIDEAISEILAARHESTLRDLLDDLATFTHRIEETLAEMQMHSARTPDERTECSVK